MTTGSRSSTERLLLIGLIALLVGLAGATTTRAESYLHFKGGFPANGVEYERVAKNGVAVSVTGSYYSISDNTYRMLGGGLKKYFGDHRVFYLAAYPSISYTTVKASDYEGFITLFGGWSSEFDGTADTPLFMLHGGLGWHGVRGWFSFGGELGAGTMVPRKLDVEGVRTQSSWSYYGSDSEESEPYTWKDWEIFGRSVVPMGQLYIGVRL